MENNYQELRERYQNLSTDDLLQIKVSTFLTDIAKLALEDELSKRDIAPDDIEYAKKVEGLLEADRDSLRKKVSRRIWRFVIPLGLAALIAIVHKFSQYSSVMTQ